MEKNVFDQPVKSDMRTYDNIRKIATGQFIENFWWLLLATASVIR